MNSNKKNGILISITINCNYNVAITQPIFKFCFTIFTKKSRLENGAMFACQMHMVLATKNAKPTYQLPKINAKNVESLSAAIIFCKSNQNAKSCCKVPNFTKYESYPSMLFLAHVVYSALAKAKTENIVIKSLLQKR